MFISNTQRLITLKIPAVNPSGNMAFSDVQHPEMNTGNRHTIPHDLFTFSGRDHSPTRAKKPHFSTLQARNKFLKSLGSSEEEIFRAEVERIEKEDFGIRPSAAYTQAWQNLYANSEQRKPVVSEESTEPTTPNMSPVKNRSRLASPAKTPERCWDFSNPDHRTEYRKELERLGDRGLPERQQIMDDAKRLGSLREAYELSLARKQRGRLTLPETHSTTPQDKPRSSSPVKAQKETGHFVNTKEAAAYFRTLESGQKTEIMARINALKQQGVENALKQAIEEFWKENHAKGKQAVVSEEQSVQEDTHPKVATTAAVRTEIPDFSTEEKQAEFMRLTNEKDAFAALQISTTTRALHKNQSYEKIVARKIACEQEWQRQQAKSRLSEEQLRWATKQVNRMKKQTKADFAARFEEEMKIYGEAAQMSNTDIAMSEKPASPVSKTKPQEPWKQAVLLTDPVIAKPPSPFQGVEMKRVEETDVSGPLQTHQGDPAEGIQEKARRLMTASGATPQKPEPARVDMTQRLDRVIQTGTPTQIIQTLENVYHAQVKHFQGLIGAPPDFLHNYEARDWYYEQLCRKNQARYIEGVIGTYQGKRGLELPIEVKDAVAGLSYMQSWQRDEIQQKLKGMPDGYSMWKEVYTSIRFNPNKKSMHNNQRHLYEMEQYAKAVRDLQASA